MCQDALIIADDVPPKSGPQFKVVLIFHLEPGQAAEELRRSRDEMSFPNRLARQPGFVEMQLVKLNEDETMSVQTWESSRDWWTGLEAVKHESEGGPAPEDRPSILVSRDFHAGPVVHELRAGRRRQTPR